jgi:hypothetical protein
LSATQARSYTRLAVAAVIAAVVIVAAIFAASADRTSQTTPSSNPGSSSAITSGIAVTLHLPTTSSTASTPSSQISCVQTGLHGSLFIRVVSDSGPIEGANTTATILDYCDSGYGQPNALGLTNSTGYAPSFIGWTGIFTVSVTYAGAEYTFPAQTNGGVTLATLSLPSGVVVEKAIACGGLDCFNDTTTITASSSQTTSSSNATSQTTCIVSSSPGPFFVRVVSDSDQTPIAGAMVTATSETTTVSCSGLADGTSQIALSFITNGTEWYQLPTSNMDPYIGYSIAVAYAGQTDNFNASLSFPPSVTCATLYLPSGTTNVTMTSETFPSGCPSSITTTTAAD